MRLTDAYACFGAKARNPRRPSWSARSDDGQTVVLAMEHDLNRDGETVTIDLFGWMGAGPPRRGNKERVENLIHARDHLDSLFRVVVVPAKDPRCASRQTPDCQGEGEACAGPRNATH